MFARLRKLVSINVDDDAAIRNAFRSNLNLNLPAVLWVSSLSLGAYVSYHFATTSTIIEE